MKKLKKTLLIPCLLLAFLFTGCQQPANTSSDQQVQDNQSYGEFNLDSIPSYSDSPYATVNQNVPFFNDEEMSEESYESYSDLDSLGRCGVAEANIGEDLMPTEDRESISQVKPSGWMNKKYDGVDGGYLYNRCHLIGFQLTAENANEKNLITGTRYMNTEGMLPFENMVADYIKETGNHVLYRVTPVFEGDNLLATGVLMEAKSVEDDGEGILYNVFCYNVQPGIEIDYSDGSSTLAEESIISEEADDTILFNPNAANGNYVVNSNNGKIHQAGKCSATGNGDGAMTDPVYFETYEEAEEYSVKVAPDLQDRQCGNCW